MILNERHNTENPIHTCSMPRIKHEPILINSQISQIKLRYKMRDKIARPTYINGMAHMKHATVLARSETMHYNIKEAQPSKAHICM